jgi:hypothetical protein
MIDADAVGQAQDRPSQLFTLCIDHIGSAELARLSKLCRHDVGSDDLRGAA